MHGTGKRVSVWDRQNHSNLSDLIQQATDCNTDVKSDSSICQLSLVFYRHQTCEAVTVSGGDVLSLCSICPSGSLCSESEDMISALAVGQMDQDAVPGLGGWEFLCRLWRVVQQPPPPCCRSAQLNPWWVSWTLRGSWTCNLTPTATLTEA